MVAMRLLWVLEHVPGLREAADRGEAMFGCVDTWLLYKLTGKHVTEGQCSVRCYSLELETKVKRMFPKVSQSRRRPLLGPSPG